MLLRDPPSSGRARPTFPTAPTGTARGRHPRRSRALRWRCGLLSTLRAVWVLVWLTGRRPQGRCIQGRGLARACQCSAPKLKRKHPAAGGQVLWIQKVRFGSAPLFAQQTNTAAIVCTITIYQIQVNNIWKSFGNHLENCTTNKHCNKLCPMDVAATSVRRSDRMHRFADSGQACPSRLSICPLFGCAGHS